MLPLFLFLWNSWSISNLFWVLMTASYPIYYHPINKYAINTSLLFHFKVIKLSLKIYLRQIADFSHSNNIENSSKWESHPGWREDYFSRHNTVMYFDGVLFQQMALLPLEPQTVLIDTYLHRIYLPFQSEDYWSRIAVIAFLFSL